MSGRRSRYFDPSAVRTPGFIHRPTSASGRLSLKERHKRKRRRANAVSPLPSSAPPQDEQVTATTCSICLSNVVGPAGLPCNHIFCFGCITKWARETATTCPLCKKGFKEVVVNQGQGETRVAKFKGKIQRCPDDDIVHYDSLEEIVISSGEEAEEEEVIDTRGMSYGYVADGFVVVEESELDSLSDEIESESDNESILDR